jgi:GTPase
MEKVITIGIQTTSQSSAAQASLDELERLVETAGGTVIESHLQRRDRPDPATFVGKGKAAELAERAYVLHAQALVFDDELKPGQQRNLEELTPAKIIDRTRLILDIFAQRARSREGMLQVELAQLSYMLPRVTQKFGRFEQQTGGIGTRGPGESKLEVDRRRIRDRMVLLKKQIERISQERTLQRTVRRGIPVPQIALVGYTNAGKSTLLNALLKHSAGAPHATEHRVYADDKLFATLDPTTRRIRLASGKAILFTDTVGFIRKLPTELIASFRATLEETAVADLLIHVVDASDPGWREQEKIVHKVLEDLGMGQLPHLTAYNKIDRLPSSQKSAFSRLGGVLLSAQKGEGLEHFLEAIENQLSANWIEKELMIPFKEGKRLARLHESMEVLSKETTPSGIRVRVRAHPSILSRFMADHD